MKIVGHRGARGLAPENTIAAVQLALAHHVDEIELDVRVTSDGIAVLNHDAIISPEHGPSLSIADHTWDILKAAKPDMITLAEALQAIDRQATVMVEVKPRVDTRAVATEIERFLADGWQPTDFTLGSFSQKTLRQLHEALPTLPVIIIERFSGAFATRRARQIGTKQISINHFFAWPGFVRSSRRRGYHLYVYTLNSPQRAARLARHGLYGVITDYPDRFTS